MAAISTALYCARSRGRRCRGSVRLLFVVYRLLRRGAGRSRELAEHVRSTGRADPVARTARHSTLRTLPANVSLTPGTLDEEVALVQRYEALAVLSILCLERAKPCGQLFSIPQHSGTRSSHTRPRNVDHFMPGER